MKSFKTILEENKIHVHRKMHPTISDITYFVENNIDWKVWQALKENDKAKLYKDFFKQFFTLVTYDKESCSIVLNDKYTFYIYSETNLKIALYLKKRTTTVSNLHYHTERPLNINICIKNVNTLNKKISDYIIWLDEYSVWVDEQLKEMKTFKENTVKYREDIEKTLAEEFPKGVNYLSNGGTVFYPHNNIRIEVDTNSRKIIPKIDIKKMPLEKQLKLIKYAMELM